MNLMRFGKWYLLFSLLIMLPGIISLAKFGLNLSIDFTGGSVFEYSFTTDSKPSTEEIVDLFRKNGLDVKKVKYVTDSRIQLQTNSVDTTTNDLVTNAVLNVYPNTTQDLFETVGPAVGSETQRKSFMAIFVAMLGILVYIAYAFRNIPKPYKSYKFGVSALVAMLHDVLVVVGIFSILGVIYGYEVDSLFITALLTVIGFSVHDSIVVFDRVRENLLKLSKTSTFENVVNFSLVETLNRSLATSFTVLIVLFSLFLLGGASIKVFVLALLVGILSGTYSSIFTACPILVLWEHRNKK
ncbi:MAG: protein translocase subunit SecF [Patescibacteria group bacterium]